MDEKTFSEAFYERVSVECKSRGITLSDLGRAIGKGDSYIRVSRSKNVCPSAYTFMSICSVLGLSADSIFGNSVDVSKMERLLSLYESNITFRKIADSLM